MLRILKLSERLQAYSEAINNMDDFLNYLIKKSDLQNNNFFNYRQPKQKIRSQKIEFDIISEPVANDYVVFDLETTGMSYEKDRIIEIGAIKVTDNKITGTFNMLVNPECYISPYISNIVHITNDMVSDKPVIAEAMPYFIDFAKELPLIAHNARFDISFMKYNAENLGYSLNNSVLDTLRLSRKYNKECKKHNLGYLTEFFNINLKNAHRAYFDALATYELYKIIQNKYLNM